MSQPSGPQQDVAPGKCSRCGKVVQLTADVMTIGYYNVAPGTAWAQFARSGETVICDACMWADPLYVAAYGASGAEVWEDDGA